MTAHIESAVWKAKTRSASLRISGKKNEIINNLSALAFVFLRFRRARSPHSNFIVCAPTFSIFSDIFFLSLPLLKCSCLAFVSILSPSLVFFFIYLFFLRLYLPFSFFVSFTSLSPFILLCFTPPPGFAWLRLIHQKPQTAVCSLQAAIRDTDHMGGIVMVLHQSLLLLVPLLFFVTFPITPAHPSFWV